jgi:UDP-glucose 4-epimerase
LVDVSSNPAGGARRRDPPQPDRATANRLMRVAVFGATGHLGNCVVRSLLTDKRIDRVIGVVRHVPDLDPFGIEWHEVSVSSDDLVPVLRGVDVVVQLRWAHQPAHDPAALSRINVEGSRRVFDAMLGANVNALVYVSSVAAYSPAPGQRVGEDHPIGGVPGSVASAQRVAVERLLDRFETEHELVRVARLRPALVLDAGAVRTARRSFLGRQLLSRMTVPGRAPMVPDLPGLAVQVVHGDDLGDAVRRAVTGPVNGAFNIAAEPVLTPAVAASEVDGRRVPLPEAAARWLGRASFALHLQPAEPGWMDLALQAPLLDTARAEAELGWQPAHSGLDALREFVDASSGVDTASTSAPRRPVNVA